MELVPQGAPNRRSLGLQPAVLAAAERRLCSRHTSLHRRCCCLHRRRRHTSSQPGACHPKETPLPTVSALRAVHGALHALAIALNTTQEAAAAGAA